MSGVVSARRWPSINSRGPVGQFAGQERVGIADFAQHGPQGVLLQLRMLAPVLGIGPQLAGRHAAKLDDSIANGHGSSEW